MDIPLVLANRYQVADLIGQGAMGVVYCGIDQETRRRIAVKVLKPEIIARNPGIVERFRREGEALRVLNHPNIVKMLNTVEYDNTHYLVMEYISGGSLDAILSAQSQLPLDQVLHIGLQLADALTRAHFLGIIHRDLKPANVMIDDEGTLHLTDFGVAHFIGRGSFTEMGALVGTMAYLSPEAYSGQPLDGRTDIWAFGVMLFEMLAGQIPFDDSSPAALISAVLTQAVPDLSSVRPDVPVDLADLVQRMLVKNRDERIPSVRLVGAEIERIMKMAEMTPAYDAMRLSAAQANANFNSPTPESEQPNRLPVLPTPFIGRERELTHLTQQLADSGCHLLTIIGPGGMGKTRLSIEAARRQISAYPHGVYFVPLAPLASPDHLASAIADSVSLQFSAGGAPREQLLNFLREKQMLLVMDNFEHLLAGVSLISEIVSTAPGIKVIATSRARLNISAEWVYEVGGMQYPQHEDEHIFENFEAVQLFEYYARRVNPEYELADEDKPAIARICQVVGGMPLGIELAAAWVHVLPPQEIAQELEADVDFLTSEMGDLPERQRSMRAVFNYSWNLLNEAEQSVLARMSVFRGGATRQAVQVVTGASLAVLTNLVNKSLIKRDPVAGRFALHELMRQYAEERLYTMGVAEKVIDAHAAYYAEALAKAEPNLKGGDQIAALDAIASDIDNVRAAWQWALAYRRYDLLNQALESLHLYYFYESYFVDAADLLTHTVESLRQPGGDERLLGRALLRLSAHLLVLSRRETLAPITWEALDIARRVGERAELARALIWMGRIAVIEQNQIDEGTVLIEEALRHAEALGDMWLLALGYHNKGLTSVAITGFHDYIVYHQKAVEIREQIGDEVGMAQALINLGHANASLGEYELATHHLNRAMSTRIAQRSASYRIFPLFNLARIARNQGRYEDADQMLHMLLAEAEHLGHENSRLGAFIGLSNLHLLSGNIEVAWGYARRAADSAQHFPNQVFWAEAQAQIGLILFEEHRYDDAIPYLESGFRISSGLYPILADLTPLVALAEIALIQGNPAVREKIMAVWQHSITSPYVVNRTDCALVVAKYLYSIAQPEQVAEILAALQVRIGTPVYVLQQVDALLARLSSDLPRDQLEFAIERGKQHDIETLVERFMLHER